MSIQLALILVTLLWATLGIFYSPFLFIVSAVFATLTVVSYVDTEAILKDHEKN